MFFETINTIKSLRAEIAELSAMEKRLSASLLQDYSDIPKVLALYENLTGASCSGGSWAVVANRKKFIFVAVFLFAPLMMLGGSMPRRLRAELGRALGVKSESSISNNWADAFFYYNHYRNFKEEAERIIDQIVRAMEL